MPEKLTIGGVEIRAPRQVVLDALTYVSGGSALDFGAGFGRHSLLLANKGFAVTAVESDADKVKSLEKKSARLGVSIQTETRGILHFDPERKQYDLVLSTMVLHFLPSWAEIEKAVRLMQQVTRSKGVDVISSYTDKNADELRPTLLNAEKLKQLYEGWDILQFGEFKREDIGVDGLEKGKETWRVELIARKKD